MHLQQKLAEIESALLKKGGQKVENDDLEWFEAAQLACDIDDDDALKECEE